MTRLERAAEARRLVDSGLTWEQAGRAMGMTKGGVGSLLNDPDGSKQRARREGYLGVCDRCGGTTRYSGRGVGPTSSTTMCLTCRTAVRAEERKWTTDRVVDAIQRWAAAHGGQPPVSTDWDTADPVNGYPPKTSVYRSRGNNKHSPFETWADAVEAAGFPRPHTGIRREHEVRYVCATCDGEFVEATTVGTGRIRRCPDCARIRSGVRGRARVATKIPANSELSSR